jgi:hypothetical protein
LIQGEFVVQMTCEFFLKSPWLSRIFGKEDE